MTRFVFHPQARREIRETIAWYDRRREGLGDKFQQALEKALSQLEQNPHAYPKIHGRSRKILLSRFPYRIIYRLVGETIYVLAVSHGRRHPSHWRKRL